jgi:uncharacterized protein YhaN
VNLAVELQKLLDLYSQMRSMAQSNVGVLEQGNLEALDDAWQKRRSVFNKLCQARQAMNGVFDNWDAHMAVMDPEAAQRCEQLADDIKKEARSTLELDDRVAELLKKAQSDIKGKLDHIKEGRRALKAYRGSARAPKPNIHISKSG